MSAIGGKYEFYLEELKNKEMTVQLLKLLDADAYGFFHNEYEKIRHFVMTLQKNDKYGLLGNEKEILNKIAEIEVKLDEYFINHPEIDVKIRAKQREVISYKCDEIIEHIEEGCPIEKAESALKLLKRIWDAISQRHNSIEVDTIDKKFAEVMVGLQIERYKEGEQVDLSGLEKICSRDNFIFQLKERMIEMVKNQNIEESIRKNIELVLYTGKVDASLLGSQELWKALSRSSDNNNVEIIVSEEQKEMNLLKAKGKTDVKPVSSIFTTIGERIALRKKKSNLSLTYTYGRYVPHTGETSFAIKESHDLPWQRNIKGSAFKTKKIEYISGGGYCPGEIYHYCYKIVLPEGIEEIPECAFKDKNDSYRWLGEIVLPDTLVKISDEAFEGCYQLKTVTIPEKVTDIGKKAFFNCKSLKSITIPSSVTKVGDCAFIGCKELKKVTFEGRRTEIGEQKFSTTGIELIYVPKGEKQYYREMLERTNTNSSIPTILELGEINGEVKNSQTTKDNIGNGSPKTDRKEVER